MKKLLELNKPLLYDILMLASNVMMFTCGYILYKHGVTDVTSVVIVSVLLWVALKMFWRAMSFIANSPSSAPVNKGKTTL